MVECRAKGFVPVRWGCSPVGCCSCGCVWRPVGCGWNAGWGLTVDMRRANGLVLCRLSCPAVGCCVRFGVEPVIIIDCLNGFVCCGCSG